jgi:hypothetical protein
MASTRQKRASDTDRREKSRPKDGQFETSDLVIVYASADQVWVDWLVSWIVSPVLSTHPILVDGEHRPEASFWENLATRPLHSCVLVLVSRPLASLYGTHGWEKLWGTDMSVCRYITLMTYLDERVVLEAPVTLLFPPICIELHGKSEEEARLAVYDALTGLDQSRPRAPFPGRDSKTQAHYE